MFDDYPVQYRPDTEVEEVADEVRQRLFGADLPGYNLLRGLRRFGGLKIVPQPDDQLGRYEAYVSFNPKRIFCRQSVYDGLSRGEPASNGVIAHELGHYVLHPAKALRFLSTNGNAAAAFIHPNESAERQAWLYADAFQMPRWSVWQVDAVSELAQLCNVPLERAEKRWDEVRKHPTLKPTRIDPIEAAWELAEQIRGKDPRIIRKAGIYQIERTEVNKMTHCGWFVRDEKPIAWMTLDHNWF